MQLLVMCFKLVMNFIYAILKLFPIQNKVTFISRQANEASRDFKMLIEKIQKENEAIKIVVLAKKLEKGFWRKVMYGFHMLRQMYHIATSKVVILDSYCIPVCILKHKKKLTVIQIWHALGSLKKFGYSALDKKDGRSSKIAKAMQMHKNYTYVLTSSKISKEYFKEAFDATEEQMLVMNLPRVDFLKSNKAKQEIADKFYQIYPEANNGKKNILYCPTMRKNSNIPLEKMLKEIQLEKYNFVIKLHNGKEVVHTKNEKIERGKHFSGMELLHIGDYIITDYSAIVYEATVAQKPIYFYAYDYEEYKTDRGTYIDYEKEMPGVITADFKQIIKLIEENKYDKERQKQFCNKYIENLDKNATEELTKLIIQQVTEENNESKV